MEVLNKIDKTKLELLKKYFINNLDIFDEKFYVSVNKDLIKKIRNKKQAIQHVLQYGFTENRIIYSYDEHNKNLFLILYPEKNDVINFLYSNKDNFDVDYYVEKYPDLKSLKIKEKLWNHFIHNGINETRELFKDDKTNFKVFCLIHNIDYLDDIEDNEDEDDEDNDDEDNEDDEVEEVKIHENEVKNKKYKLNKHDKKKISLNE